MKLSKELSLLDVFCIATGAMISSGLFILPGIAHAKAGPAVVVSYFFAGLLALTGVLSVAELSTAMPKAAGDYFFITRSMGDAVGTVAGLLSWLALSLKSSFALIGMAAFTTRIIPVPIQLIALCLTILFLAINILGVKEASRFQVVLVMALLSLLIFYVFCGFPKVKIAYYEPFVTNGWGAVFGTTGLVFVSYGGLLKVASISEEISNPKRNIPLGMIVSLVVVLAVYSFVIFVTSGILGAGQLDNSLTPISDGAQAAIGGWGRIILDIAAVCAFVSTANAGIMAASRYPYALSRDKLIPEIFAKVSERFKTPYLSILLTGAIMGVFLFFKLEILVETASTVLILTYMLSTLSIIILRESRVQNYQPSFKAPFYPWAQIIGIIGFGFLIFEMGKEAILISVALIASGLFAYWFYGRIRTTREYALLHLIERITAKDFTGRLLESELREIIKERDDITKDRFDQIVEKSVVIDLDGPMKYNDMFKIVSEKVAKRIKLTEDKMYNLLLEREKESSTVIAPYLAIPHIIIEGNNIFDIVLVRCKKGIEFSEANPRVQAVFMLFGTSDERNFHLRALASIAQIAQNPKIDHKWLSAKSEEGLRDVVLLGKRRRFKK